MSDTDYQTPNETEDEGEDFYGYFHTTELEKQQDFRWMMEILRDGYIYGGENFTNVPEYSSTLVERLGYDEAQRVNGMGYLPIAPGRVFNGGGFGGSGRNFEVDDDNRLHAVMDCCINVNEWDGDVYKIEIDEYENETNGTFYRIELENTFMYVALEGNAMIENYEYEESTDEDISEDTEDEDEEIEYDTGFRNWLSNEFRGSWDSALSIIAEWCATQDNAIIRAREDGIINSPRNQEKVRKIFRYGIKKAYEKKLEESDNYIMGDRVLPPEHSGGGSGELSKEELMSGLEEITDGNDYMYMYLNPRGVEEHWWMRIYEAFNRLQSGDAPADGDILDFLKVHGGGEGMEDEEEEEEEERPPAAGLGDRNLFPDGLPEWGEARPRPPPDLSRGGGYDQEQIEEIMEAYNINRREAIQQYLGEIREYGDVEGRPGAPHTPLLRELTSGREIPQRTYARNRRPARREAEDDDVEDMGARQERMRGESRATPRNRRCPNGFRRNRTTGECDPVNRPAPSVSAAPNLVDNIIRQALARGGEDAEAVRRNVNIPRGMEALPTGGFRVLRREPDAERTRRNLAAFNALNLGD
jgi:hypothetical protein